MSEVVLTKCFPIKIYVALRIKIFLCEMVMYFLFLQSLRSGLNLFNQLSKILRLTKVQEVAFGLALLSSTKQDTQQAAAQFVKLRLNSLLVSYIGGGNEIRLRCIVCEMIIILLIMIQAF